jgi:hypothetical protein
MTVLDLRMLQSLRSHQVLQAENLADLRRSQDPLKVRVTSRSSRYLFERRTNLKYRVSAWYDFNHPKIETKS